MGAVAADEAPVLIGDHRPVLDADKAMGAADDEGCIGQVCHRVLDIARLGPRGPILQTLETYGSLTLVPTLGLRPRRDFGRVPTYRQSGLLRISNKKPSVTLLPTDFWDDPFLENPTSSLTFNKTEVRRGTRIRCEISVTLVNLDPLHPFSQSCQILLVNLNGCAARCTRAVEIGAAVELQGLPTRTVTARIVTCFSLGEYEKIWLLGMELHSPGNVWGIEHVPA